MSSIPLRHTEIGPTSPVVKPSGAYVCFYHYRRLCDPRLVSEGRKVPNGALKLALHTIDGRDTPLHYTS